MVSRNLVRVFNVGTGAWVRDLEKTEHSLVGIAFDSENSKLLIGCDQKGNVIVWKWRSGVKVKRLPLLADTHDAVVLSFNLVPNDDMESEDQQQVLLSHWNKQTQAIKVETFDLESGKPQEEFSVEM